MAASSPDKCCSVHEGHVPTALASLMDENEVKSPSLPWRRSGACGSCVLFPLKGYSKAGTVSSRKKSGYVKV